MKNKEIRGHDLCSFVLFTWGPHNEIYRLAYEVHSSVNVNICFIDVYQKFTPAKELFQSFPLLKQIRL